MNYPHLTAVLITLGDPAQLTGGYLFHRRLAELAPTYGASLQFASFPPRPFPLGLLHTRDVLKDVDRRRPDVVVIDSIIAWCFAVQGPRQPAVGMLHQPPGGIDFGPLRTSVQARMDRLAYRHLNRILVASDSLADELRPVGLQVCVVPPGRDVASDLGPPPGDLRQGRRMAALCVGNWLERKGILDLLEAVALLDQDATTLHLLGRTNVDAKYARRVWARLAQADLVGRVVVHGPLSVSEVAALYAAADVFVLPSLKEPYGTVYGEAMAFGLPVVGWRAGNLPYLAAQAAEGLLVEPRDVVGLTIALRRLANDADLRRQLGAAARERALARPTWDQVAAIFFQHLREVSNT
ncbi:MAG: glycosyltransferase family 4 protein [Chloroflexi bacterium]|nr:glycosyltransferase family 4 protein [Chloroflexota bacterium]